METLEDGNEGTDYMWPDWTGNSDWQVKQEFPYDGNDASWDPDWKGHQQSGGWNGKLEESWDDQQGQSWDANNGQEDEFPWWAYRQKSKSIQTQHGMRANAGKEDEWGGHYTEHGYYVDPKGKQWECLG